MSLWWYQTSGVGDIGLLINISQVLTRVGTRSEGEEALPLHSNHSSDGSESYGGEFEPEKEV
jgi:hypothetical protein